MIRKTFFRYIYTHANLFFCSLKILSWCYTDSANSHRKWKYQKEEAVFSGYEINVQYLIYCLSRYCDGLIKFVELEIWESSRTMQNGFENPLGFCELLLTAFQGTDWWFCK